MRISYFTPSSFRTVNAGALRNVGIAKALVLAGHEVTIVSSDNSADKFAEEWEWILDGSPIRFLRAGPPRGKRLEVGSLLHRYLIGSTFRLARTLELTNPEALILYNADPIALLRLNRVAHVRRIPFSVEITEWLNAADLPGGKFSPLAALHEVTMRALSRRREPYIAISKKMAGRVAGRGQTIVVPPIFGIGSCITESELRSTGRIHLVTTGTDLRLAGKDITGLSLIVNALAEVDPAGDIFHLDVVGSCSEKVQSLLRSRLKNEAITLHGRLSWQETLMVVRNASFSVVIRNPLDRRSNLGFPSKVPESLLLGTPIMANAFSDLPEHLEDGVNAVLLDDLTPESIAAALRRLPMEFDRKSIRALALARYAPSVWSDTLSDFVAGKP